MSDRLRKVEALRDGAATPGERQAAEAAAARISGKVAVYREPDMAAEVLAVLANLGYRLVPNSESRPGAKYVESDDTHHHLVTHLRAVTSMSELPEPADWFRRLTTGKRIMLPERHPSGLASQEQAFTNVTPLGAGTHTPPRGRNEI
jgi:hypothetical protein